VELSPRGSKKEGKSARAEKSSEGESMRVGGEGPRNEANCYEAWLKKGCISISSRGEGNTLLKKTRRR